MQIAGQNTREKKGRSYLPLLAIPALLGLMVLVFINRGEQRADFFCDMETLAEGGSYFKSNRQNFTGGKNQSDEKALSGRYSAKCDGKNIYGPTITLEQINSGDIIEASVWQQTDEGFGGLVLQGMWGTYFKSKNQADKVRNGWERLRIVDTIPLGVKNGSMKVYPSITAKSGTVYFDDIKIKHLKNRKRKDWNTQAYKGPNLQLQVEERSMNKLKLKRSEAFEMGNLMASKKDLVPAKLKDGQEEMDVQVRLKGDLLDHLQGKKWSFRVVPEKGRAWKGMKAFSIHNSRSRYHLLEWIFHKMLEEEDILTTQYDFVQLSLNEEQLGIYAYEEHFAYPLLYRQKRERGPIIRINEDGLWQYASKGLSDEMPWFESGQIEAFEGKEILQDEQLYQQFLSGQNLIYDFIQGKGQPEDLFDTELLAKFIAILDVCMAWHAFGAINQRFYYNAILGKLEPIGYDGFTDDGHRWYRPPLIYGSKINSRVSKRFRFRNVIQHFHYYLFNDYDFTEKYLHFLEQFTAEPYLNAFVEKYLSEIKSREKFIQQEYHDFKFDKNQVFKNASAIREVLYPSANVSIKAYRNNDGSIALENYHFLPIEILGFGDQSIQYRPPNRLIVEAYNDELPIRRYQTSVKGKAKYVFCKTLGTQQIRKLPVFKWSIPQSGFAKTAARREGLESREGILVSPDSIVYLKKGQHTIRRDLIIPEGYQLHISAGTDLLLTEGASIVSYGPLYFEGQAERPIQIRADASGQGLLVIDAKEKSMIRHTRFNNLSARNKDGQIAEGGVTFYKSDFECHHCHFRDSKGKDALNISRATYLLRQVRFEQSSGDAIDANLSSGKMEGIVVDRCGRDAIEVTGGYAELRELDIQNSFSSALNGTRNAKVEVFDGFRASNCKYGVSASDLAHLQINKIELNEIEQAFVVFQKLPEYGSARVEVSEYSSINVQQLHVIDQAATLLLKGKKVEEN